MTVWSKRGNINTAALVTIAQCNTLVARCSRQLIGPANWVFFVTLGPLRGVVLVGLKPLLVANLLPSVL